MAGTGALKLGLVILRGSALLAVSFAIRPDRVLPTALRTFAARTTWRLATAPIT